VFYGWVHPWFLGLLAISALVDFAAGLGIRRQPDRARAWLTLSLVVNLGLLGTFKYLDFFLQNVHDALSLIGLSPGIGPLGVLLPVGISFYTFQTLAYTLDVHRGRLEPTADLVDYLVFVSFFPQLVAGPIERAGDLLPQAQQPRTFQLRDQAWGVTVGLWGAFQKVVIADSLAPYVDATYALEAPPTPLLMAATVAFSIQIVADFAGYSEMARGSARLFGFRLTQNFREPYLATSPADAWGRWHITFASWLRDYVYFPLAGAAWVRRIKLPFVRDGGEWHMVRVTLLTFLIAGLWHGAAWHFVLWGLYNGALISAYTLLSRRARWLRVPAPLAIALMYLLALIGFVLFREPELARVAQYARQPPWVASGAAWTTTAGLLAVCAAAATPYAVAAVVRRRAPPDVWSRAPVLTTTWAFLAWSVWLFHRGEAADHVYFQF
jgi:D-alanyl-lipoteichoic acid acyltransferase DltB (MBOAT superfamily)